MFTALRDQQTHQIILRKKIVDCILRDVEWSVIVSAIVDIVTHVMPARETSSVVARLSAQGSELLRTSHGEHENRRLALTSCLKCLRHIKKTAPDYAHFSE